MNTRGPWRKSTRSGGSNGNCVEARGHSGRIDVRDSKLGQHSPILQLTAEDYSGLLAATHYQYLAK